jgi:hypothetical protein
VFWEALRDGFEDELAKIAEMNLSGLSSETLLTYPRPQPVASDGYAKAKAILAKAQQLQPVEKTAGPDPSVLPRLSVLGRRKKKQEAPPGKIDKAKEVGVHMLAGAGAAKFIHGAVEAGVQSRRPMPQRFWKLDPKWQVSAVATGAGLGAAEWARKRHAKKKLEKSSGAAPFKFPSTGRASAQFLGKSGPSISQQVPRIGLRGALPKI